MKFEICGFCGEYREIVTASVVALCEVKLMCKVCEQSKRNDFLKKFIDKYKHIIGNHVR